jgi:hypothetical protein
MKNPFSIICLTLFLTVFYGGSVMAQSKSNSSSYNWGVGIKLGNPNGLTIKKYSGKMAFELILGRPYYWGYNYNYTFAHDSRFRDKGYYYDHYEGVSNPLSIQLRYLVHNDFSDVQGLKWYYGIGAQLRTASYYYNYYTVDQFGDRQYYRDKVVDLGIGADGILGLEYQFKGLPISVFGDVNLYMEIFRHPFYFTGQGGIGARYNF